MEVMLRALANRLDVVGEGAWGRGMKEKDQLRMIPRSLIEELDI